MNFGEAIKFLYDLQLFGANLGLDPTRRLCRQFGHPQDRLRFVHVAGTNGKGSTCAMLESIYRAAGLRVGLYTSPHLIRFGERIQVNREPMAEEEVARQVEELRERLSGLGAGAHPTFFEVVTVMALRHFAEKECDLVIWETGLGGRLDATNIVNPLAAVITNVQLDHEKWLGHTIAQIAREKSGIIKPFRPVVTGSSLGGGLEVVREVARERRAPLAEAMHPGPWTDEGRGLHLSLLGEHQWRNAAVALATVDCLQNVIPVAQTAAARGLGEVKWPGRLQIIERAPGEKYVLDGAHNPAGMLTLRAGLERLFPAQPVTLILGAMRDKDWRAMSAIIAPLASAIHVVPMTTDRAADPEDLENACHEANPTAKTLRHGSLGEALRAAGQTRPVVVTGSLHLVGEALELLQARDDAELNERGLNEWTMQNHAPPGARP